MKLKKEKQVVDSSQKVPLGEAIAFGLGDVASNVFIQYIAVFLLVFYTDTLGIPAAVGGAIILFSRLFDGVNDVVIAYIVDKSGKYKKWCLGFALLASATFFLMFLVPGNMGPAGKSVYAVLAFSIWTIICTCYAIPYNTMSSTVTADPNERTKLTAIRFAVIMLPVAAVNILTPIIVGKYGPTWGYAVAAIIWGVIGFIGVFIFTKVCKERVPVVRNPQQKISLKETVQVIFSNKALLLCAGFFLFSNLRHNLTAAVLPYFFNYYLGSMSIYSLFSLINIPFSLFAFLIPSWVIKKLGKKNAGIFYSIFAIAVYVGRFVAADNLAAQLVLFMLHSLPSCGLTVLGFAMIPDTVDYAIRKNGKESARAVNFSVCLFVQKLSMGLSATVLGVALAAFGYVANAAQSPESLNGILMVYSIVLAVITAVAMIFILFWNFDTKPEKAA